MQTPPPATEVAAAGDAVSCLRPQSQSHTHLHDVDSHQMTALPTTSKSRRADPTERVGRPPFDCTARDRPSLAHVRSSRVALHIAKPYASRQTRYGSGQASLLRISGDLRVVNCAIRACWRRPRAGVGRQHGRRRVAVLHGRILHGALIAAMARFMRRLSTVRYGLAVGRLGCHTRPVSGRPVSV